jgi:hypothetical protein
MGYVTPHDARSPRGTWKLVEVLIDEGESPKDGPAKFSLALGYWQDEPCLAVRWNGYEGSPVGNPQSRGLATWFILPTDFNQPVMSLVPPEQRDITESLLKRAGGQNSIRFPRG